MSTTHQDQDKSSGKPRQRGRKADSRGAAAPVAAPLIGEVLPPDIVLTGVAAPAVIYPISVQAIAMAYADYAMKSFDGSRSFVEKLIGVRSFDKAIEVQTEFARQAYADFVAESQKMCELYGGLARQIFMPWERFAARVTQAGRQIQ
jgi:hypothetical protein